MKQAFILILFVILSLSSVQLIAQKEKKDKGYFEEYTNPFYDEILVGIKEFEKQEAKPRKQFKEDLSGYNLPKSTDEFVSYWHNPPVSQGNTGTCWSFSTTSFLESEIYRIHKKEVKLSEMFTVYWEYVEKAEGFINSRGESLFAQGSEANAVTRIFSEYGCVPLSVYSGMLPGQKYHGHTAMFNEMNDYLKSVKAASAWNEAEIISTIKSILNYHMGEPAESFMVEGKEYTPKTYLKDYLKINSDDYVDVVSYMQQPYFEQVEYEVADNWWHDKSYYNVPLDLFMKVFNSAVLNGYTVCIGGDVSEPGRSNEKDVFVVPSFDIPSEYIDENARQMRFSNGTTTDDHGIHVVGYKKDGDKYWYIIKDSGSGARNGNNVGYFFFHEDYVKLKIMDFMVHKDAAGEILKNFNK